MILDFAVLHNLEEKKLFKLNLDFVSEGLTSLFKKYSFLFLIYSSPSFFMSVRWWVEGVSPSGGGGLRGGSPPSKKLIRNTVKYFLELTDRLADVQI